MHRSSIQPSVPVCKCGHCLSSSTGGNTPSFCLHDCLIHCRQTHFTPSGEIFGGSTEKHTTTSGAAHTRGQESTNNKGYVLAQLYTQRLSKFHMHGRSSRCLEACGFWLPASTIAPVEDLHNEAHSTCRWGATMHALKCSV